MAENLGLTEAVSMAVGGIVGGGIYAALGIVVAAAGRLAWLAYCIATVVVVCAGYSYVKLNKITEKQGGSASYIEELTDQRTLAAVVGWTLVVGYIGTMAMYAYAFGAFAAKMIGIAHIFGVPLRPALSVLVVVLFIGLNLLGARESGIVEDVLVFLKVGIIVLFGIWGLWWGATHHTINLGLSELGIDPVIAAAVSFVSFEGWQLLLYDQEQFENPKETLTKAIYIAIPIAALIYILVSFVTTSLLPPETVSARPEAALLFASIKINIWLMYAVALSALFSTASAINATMFSTALFSKGLIEDGLLPAVFESSEEEGLPDKLIGLIGFLTILFTVYGSLTGITEFASLSFIVVFGAMCTLAYVYRGDHEDYDERISAIPPVVGALGCLLFFPLLLWHLFAVQRPVFEAVVLIALAVFSLEFLYFKRDAISRGVASFREQL